ncbi:homoserine O-acetyltransferase family protein [Lacunimicrobium album]
MTAIPTTVNDEDESEAASNETPADPVSCGLVTTQFVELFAGSEKLKLNGGQLLGPIRVAYETYGQLTPEKDNAIFICHALTGDAHVAGWHANQRKPGWWDALVGPGKTLDTNKYFVVCANVLGGCQGTTGPRSTNPATGLPWGLSFPFITIGDMVEVHVELLKHLGVTKLLAAVGGSLGGMQVLEWAVRYPDMLKAAVILASAAKLGAQGIAFNAVGRRAIYADPNFQNGEYYKTGNPPRFGLALARMIAHITYLSESSIETKFGRRLQNGTSFAFELQQETEFQIESYLHYQGKRFVERFDANSYLYLTRAMDYFDLAEAHGTLENAFAHSKARFLIASYTTDWLFPSEQSKTLIKSLIRAKRHVTYLELDSTKGHDAFLIEIAQLTEFMVPFLSSAYQDSQSKTS